METIRLEFQPSSIPEWDAEDELTSHLSTTLVTPDDSENKKMLENTRIELPKAIDHVELVKYAQVRQTPLALNIPPDSQHYNFYLIEIPLNILVVDQQLVRLRLCLQLEAAGQNSNKVVAYDIFPNDQSEVKTIATGGINLDVSNGLKLLLTAIVPGAGAVASALTDCFGFKLDLPFKWTTTYTTIRASGRMSNPVEWYVTDASIQNGFTGTVIVRAPKKSAVSLLAYVFYEVRKPGLLGRIIKSQYETIKPHIFTLED